MFWLLDQLYSKAGPSINLRCTDKTWMRSENRFLCKQKRPLIIQRPHYFIYLNVSLLQQLHALLAP